MYICSICTKCFCTHYLNKYPVQACNDPHLLNKAPACFYNRKDSRWDGGAGLQRLSTQYMDLRYKIFLTPSNSECYKVSESHILSRALHSLSLHRQQHSCSPTKGFWPLITSFLFCLGPGPLPSYLSEHCGSVAGLFSVIILWILGTLPRTWFCSGHTAPHSHSRWEACCFLRQSWEGTERKGVGENTISKTRKIKGLARAQSRDKSPEDHQISHAASISFSPIDMSPTLGKSKCIRDNP